MSTSKKIDIICIVVSVLALIITIVFMFGEKLGIKVLVDEDAEANSDLVYFTKNDLKGDWSVNSATKIKFNGSKISVTGSGAIAYDGYVQITDSGRFLVSGNLDEGKIIVDAGGQDKVWLALGGVSMNCSDDACIKIDNADKVFLTLVEGTENTLISGSAYSEATLATGTDGVIFSHDDLTINGSGILNVKAGYKHGIVSNDALVITGGDIYVSALSSALRANENLRICNASLRLDSDNKGIVVDDEGSYLYIESGKIDIYSADDAIRCRGEINYAGGELNIKAGDDGIRSDVSVSIADGTVNIAQCYEGIEAPQVNISGGTVTIYPTDDGINANGGTDGMTAPGANGEDPDGNNATARPGNGNAPEGNDATAQSGGNTGESSDAASDGSVDNVTPSVTISGGTLTIINSNGRDADGIDSNGSVYITGGKVRVFLNGDGSNNAVDYSNESGGVFEINGGDVILAGGSNMAEAPVESSGQCSVFYNLSTVSADTAVTLTTGSEEFSETIPTSFSNIILSRPSMKKGESCKLSIGSSAMELTLENTVTVLGNTGGKTNGGLPGSSDNSGRPKAP